MTLKWNREIILVIVTAIMLLIGLFYYGNLYLINPVQEEAEALTESVETQQTLIENYPPNEELLTEYENNYAETESYLPIGVQANKELITLEQLAGNANVSIDSVSRVADGQSIEGVGDEFVQNTYTIQMTGASPADFRQLITLLMNEERVWNITSFSYTKSGGENYSGSLSVNLYYYRGNQ